MNTQPQKHSKKTIFKDFSLLLAVPLSIIIILGAFIYIPRALAHPKYDFLYSTCPDYNCSNMSYTVNNSRVAITGHSNSADNQLTPTLRYYDISTNSSRSISLTDAQTLHLDNSSRSPDGYTLGHNTSESGFLFWGNSESGWTLKNGIKQKSVTLTPDEYSPTNFIGWVTQ